MKKLILVLLVSISASFGATIDDGLEAYNKGDFKTAFSIFEELAKDGDAFAQFSLGFMYANGEGVKQDYFKAKEWYEKAADQGYASAQNNLGFLYGNGQGVKQDKRKAKEWFGKACDGGNQTGCDNYKILNQAGY